MIPRTLLAATALALAPLLALAQPPRPRDSAPPAETADVQDVVFLGQTRPILLRLRIQVHDKSFTEAWNDYLGELFNYFDRDGDGVLNKAEVERAPKAQILVQQMRGSLLAGNPGTTATLAEFRTEGEEKVTFAVFTRYYRTGGAGPVHFLGNVGQGGNADAVNDALFRHLDRKKEGKLTKEDLADAVAILLKLDRNDDETVSLPELLPNANLGRFPGQVQSLPRSGPAPVNSTPFLLIPAGEPVRLQLASQLLNRYDRDRNQRLSRAEITLEKELMEAVDRNRDGELDALELVGLLKHGPVHEVVVRLGKTEAKDAVVDLVRADGKGEARDSAVRRNGDSVRITDGTAQIDLRRAGSSTAANAVNQRQFYVQQFRNADIGMKGHLEPQDVQKPQYQFLRFVFNMADRDEDGKLTEKEVLAFVELQTAAASASVGLTYTDQGQGLFDVLDVNRDGRLGIREMRNAWDRLAEFDREGKGAIERASVPRQFQLLMGLGQTDPTRELRIQLELLARAGMAPNAPTPVPTRGPLWFRKMDNNGDGDVSLREFLGRRDDFRRIDTDGDDLISLQEAEKAAEAMRTERGPSPR